jgi:histidine triad (HIT) family protein
MIDCTFCRLIARGSAGAPHLMYEDDSCVALLDRESLGWGHCMVIPKRHVGEVQDLDEREYLHLFLVARRLAASLKEATGARAVGYVAFGSGLPHAHLHLVPHDDPKILTEPRRYLRRLSDDELTANAARLRPHLERLVIRSAP